MDIIEEGTKCSLEMLEILLVDQRLKLDDRQVFIVEGVAPGHAHFMAKRWTEHRILKREASEHVQKRINRPVGHGSVGVFCREWRGGGLGDGGFEIGGFNSVYMLLMRPFVFLMGNRPITPLITLLRKANGGYVSGIEAIIAADRMHAISLRMAWT